MAGVEIHEYSGDFEDVAELTRRVWIPEYAGLTWVPIPDASFLQWMFEPNTGALCPAAYDGSKIVGTVFSLSRSLRVGSTVYPVSLYTGFTVDPEYRRMALPLVERLRRDNEERKVAFGIGMVLDSPTSISYRFWTKYAQSFPQNFRFIFEGGYWSKFLAPRVMARAGVQAWERVAARTIGPLVQFTPHGYDPHVRPYRTADLERCVQLLDKAYAGYEWAMIWDPKRLATQLQHPEYQTFVFERDGIVQGMVNCHCASLQGRELIRVGMLDLWAEGDLNLSERVRLVSHLCTDQRERGVHALIALRAAMTPSAALVANLFLPHPQRFRIGIFLTPRTVPLSPPKTWSFEIT